MRRSNDSMVLIVEQFQSQLQEDAGHLWDIDFYERREKKLINYGSNIVFLNIQFSYREC